MSAKQGCSHKGRSHCTSLSAVCCNCEPSYWTWSDYCESCRVLAVRLSPPTVVTPRDNVPESTDQLSETPAMPARRQPADLGGSEPSIARQQGINPSPVPQRRHLTGEYQPRAQTIHWQPATRATLAAGERSLRQSSRGWSSAEHSSENLAAQREIEQQQYPAEPVPAPQEEQFASSGRYWTSFELEDAMWDNEWSHGDHRGWEDLTAQPAMPRQHEQMEPVPPSRREESQFLPDNGTWSGFGVASILRQQTQSHSRQRPSADHSRYPAIQNLEQLSHHFDYQLAGLLPQRRHSPQLEQVPSRPETGGSPGPSELPTIPHPQQPMGHPSEIPSAPPVVIPAQLPRTSLRAGEWRIGSSMSSDDDTPTRSPPSGSHDDIPVPSVSEPAATRISLRKVAENASILLELFSQSCPDDDDDIDHDHQMMITCAADEIVVIQARIRESVARRNGGIRAGREVEDCIICYSATADTVFMPCKHLVVCMEACCDTMGIGVNPQVPVRCPVCRTGIVETIRIFRG